MYRAKFLSHWTGKDIEENNHANKTDEYIKRLWSILSQGLHMNKIQEVVYGRGPDGSYARRPAVAVG